MSNTNSSDSTPTWRTKVAEKRAQRQKQIPTEWLIATDKLPPPEQRNVMSFPETCGLLTSKEIEITTIAEKEERRMGDGAHALLDKMKRGEWSAVEVMTAFTKRALVAHQTTNCLTEIFIEEALKKAEKLDEHFKKTGEVVGPLHGLPVSLKDQINVKGIESTMGYVSWIGDVAKKNAVLVDILESLGAIPFVKTNVPQTLMWAETFNYVFGRTVNPYNRELTAGGSSGGEGALIAMQGSPLGVGSDIGGSIRIPSGYCGIYGLRPSFHRIPYGNCRNSLEGQESVPSVLGPMAPGISMIKLFMKTVLSKRPWMMDPLVIRKAWSEDEYKLNDHGGGKRLCFGILWDDGVIIPNPPVTRGLEEVKAALVSARHQVVDWKPIKHKEIFNAIANIFAAGCAEDFEMTCAIEDEPLVSSMTIEEELKVETGEVSRPEVKGVSAFQLWQVQKKRRDLRQEYLDWWQSSQEWAQTDTGRPIDAIICPVAPHVAPLHGKTVSDHYTMVWNALDYPGLVIPVSRVDPVRDIKVERSELLGDDDRANYEGYDPEAFRDAPISIQLIGRTLEEEALIGMAEIVDAALKKARE